MIVIERNPPNEEPKRVMIKRIPWILSKKSHAFPVLGNFNNLVVA